MPEPTQKELIEYIKSQIDSGVSREQVVKSLREAGWLDVDINYGFQSFEGSSSIVQSKSTYNPTQGLNQKRKVIIMSFVGILALIIFASLLYLFVFKNQTPMKGLSEIGTEQKKEVVNGDDVHDFDSCISYAKNLPISFSIHFKTGSNFDEVKNFVETFKGTFPRSQIDKISSEADFVNYNLETQGARLSSKELENYKEQLALSANSEVSVRVPMIDLGTEEEFNKTMEKMFEKHPLIVFQSYSGSAPTQGRLDAYLIKEMQQARIDQCNHRYKELNESERSALEINEGDSHIRTMIAGTIVKATLYYESHDFSYAEGTLSLNNGLCADSGVYSLKETLRAIIELSGSAFCYASSTGYAVSAPLKSDPKKGYCADSVGYRGESSPAAAEKGYCVSEN